MIRYHIPRERRSVIDDLFESTRRVVGITVGCVFGGVVLLSLSALVARLLGVGGG